MVAPLLFQSFITKGLREALPFLTYLVEANPTASARSIIADARASGLSFTDTGAFRVIGQLKANLDARRLFGLLDDNELPEPETLGVALGDLRKNYSFAVEIVGLNRASGERETRHVTIVSDDLLTPNQILETAIQLPTHVGGSMGLENAQYRITGGLRRED